MVACVQEDGKVRILDAYCPHMGANLGVTGQVVGNDIVCPFHGWQFDGEGKCTKIPYAEKVPGFLKTTAWPCVEMNGSIMLWHDAEGRPPLWMPSDIKQINSGAYKWHGSSLHQVRAHIQVICLFRGHPLIPTDPYSSECLAPPGNPREWAGHGAPQLPPCSACFQVARQARFPPHLGGQLGVRKGC